jgi:hydroxymethylglutaryl-CoA lyase
MTPGAKIRIVEVGPRDGLQNEKAALSIEAKVAFVDALSECGFYEIEAGAFVSPKAVPQMAGSEEVFRRIRRAPGVLYSALVPNERGLERALASKADKIAVFTAASETFNLKNINASIAESLERFRPVAEQARRAGLPLRAYISTAFWCPYEGKVAPAAAVDVTKRLLDLGVDEISIGDTIGKAVPAAVRALLTALLSACPLEKLALHFHDTYGAAVANALTAWHEFGVTAFDSSAGGLGGCPYAPGASGNVATEDLAWALKQSGAEITVDIEKTVQAANVLKPHLGRSLASRLSAVAGK